MSENPIPPRELRTDTANALADVKRYAEEALKDFQQVSKNVAELSMEMKSLDGQFRAVGETVRLLAYAGIRAEVASLIGTFIQGDDQTDEECLATIERTSFNALNGYLFPYRIPASSISAELDDLYRGFNEFSQYQYAVKIIEWQKYLDLTTTE